MLHCLASRILAFAAVSNAIYVYADFPGMYACEAPLTTIPSSLIIAPYRPDIVIYNEIDCTVALFELTFLLDFFQRLESTRDRKQPGKEEYLQVFS